MCMHLCAYNRKSTLGSATPRNNLKTGFEYPSTGYQPYLPRYALRAAFVNKLNYSLPAVLVVAMAGDHTGFSPGASLDPSSLGVSLDSQNNPNSIGPAMATVPALESTVPHLLLQVRDSRPIGSARGNDDALSSVSSLGASSENRAELMARRDLARKRKEAAQYEIEELEIEAQLASQSSQRSSAPSRRPRAHGDSHRGSAMMEQNIQR